MILKKTIKYFFLAIFIIAIGYFSAVIFSRPAQKETVATISNEQEKVGKVLAGEDPLRPSEGEAGSNFPPQGFISQNFHSPQITFGGDAITVPSGQQSIAPEIIDLRSELLLVKNDQQVKFLLSWKTNKPCVSSIAYTKEGQAETKTVSENNYGFIHSVEIAPLSYSTSYSYTVTARDKWGNENQSEKLAFYTGAPNVSIFDLLGGAFKDMFGWAGGK
jgi:hypothetical protein